MRFYTQQHRYYCRIDLHARKMYIGILDAAGEVVLHRNGTCSPRHFLRVIAPYRDDVVVAVERMFTWYWLADLCAEQGITRTAKVHDADAFHHLRSVCLPKPGAGRCPGIGKILALVILCGLPSGASAQVGDPRHLPLPPRPGVRLLQSLGQVSEIIGREALRILGQEDR